MQLSKCTLLLVSVAALISFGFPSATDFEERYYGEGKLRISYVLKVLAINLDRLLKLHDMIKEHPVYHIISHFEKIITRLDAIHAHLKNLDTKQSEQNFTRRGREELQNILQTLVYFDDQIKENKNFFNTKALRSTWKKISKRFSQFTEDEDFEYVDELEYEGIHMHPRPPPEVKDSLKYIEMLANRYEELDEIAEKVKIGRDASNELSKMFLERENLEDGMTLDDIFGQPKSGICEMPIWWEVMMPKAAASWKKKVDYHFMMDNYYHMLDELKPLDAKMEELKEEVNKRNGVMCLCIPKGVKMLSWLDDLIKNIQLWSKNKYSQMKQDARREVAGLHKVILKAELAGM